MRKITLLFALLVTVTFLIFLARADEPDDSRAHVQLLVRGPDSAPLVNVPVTLQQADTHASRFKPQSIQATTDAKGMLHFDVIPGVATFAVSVPGIGYGNIGLTEFVAGQNIQPDLPALAPYGSIEGKLPPEPRFTYIDVHAARIYAGQDEKHVATPGDNDRFFLSDLPAGAYWLYAGPSNGRSADLGHQVILLPGQHLQAVDLQPIPAAEVHPQVPIHAAPLPGAGQTIVWAQGIVRDDAGKPVPNATIYALAIYHGGMRMYESTAKATTDDHGHYELKGPGGMTMFSATLLATAPGKTTAWAWPSFPDSSVHYVPIDAATQPATLPAPPVQDFVLSSHGCSFDVTVLENAKPVPGAAVGMYLENANLKDEWAAPGGDPEIRLAIENAAYPVATTDNAGIAHFSNLLPGRYHLIATSPPAHDPQSTKFDDPRQNLRWIHDRIFENIPAPCAFADGIPISSSSPATFRVSLASHPGKAAFRLLRHDGAPLTGRPAFSYGPVDTVQSATGATTDETGAGTFAFTSGLWHFQSYYRQQPVEFVPYDEPFYAASGTLAVSPNLTSPFVPTFTARYIAPGSAHIRVLDENGKPFHAAVAIERPVGLACASGSTDAAGSILFTGLVHWNDYVVRAFAPGFEPLDLGDRKSPLPPLEKLQNRTEFLAQRLAVVPDKQIQLTFRPQPVGYIYGTVAPPQDGKRKYSALYVNTPSSPAAAAHIDPSTGRYVAGPFAQGPVELALFDLNTNHRATFATSARGGAATRFDFAEPAASSELTSTTGGSLMFSIGGASMPTRGKLSARVFLADNVTPAWGPQLLYFEPHNPRPALLALCDPQGNAMSRPFWRDMNAPPPGSNPGPDAPLLLAFLPGSCGATILTPSPNDKLPDRIFLPPAISLSGQVTVAGIAPTHRPGAIRVLAARRDNPLLNPYLSVQTTADADGRFTLAGLTPGDYQVQAALDDIWLSAPLALHVDPAKKIDPATLDIPAPGAPVRIYLQDPDGKPAPGQSISLDRPGPLGEILWPKSFTSDGAGLVFIPTLEAGPQLLHAPHNPKPIRFTVPPLPAENPLDLSLKLPPQDKDNQE